MSMDALTIAGIVLVLVRVLRDERLRILSRIDSDWLPLVTLLLTMVGGTATLVSQGVGVQEALLTSALGALGATGAHQLQHKTRKVKDKPKEGA